MKKLNITKKQFKESQYFTNKYGNLAYVSESGKLYKTDKGNVLKFKESVTSDDSYPFTVTDIEWDTDGEDASEFNLPETLVVDVPMVCVDNGSAEVEDYISDYLSDTYGFTHNGFSVDGLEDEPIDESNKNDWFGIKGARFIYHGDWNDPEVQYDGVSLNYWDVEAILLDEYREEHPDDKNDKGFNDWMALPSTKNSIQSALDILVQGGCGKPLDDEDEEAISENIEKARKLGFVGDEKDSDHWLNDKYGKHLNEVYDKIESIVGEKDAKDVYEYWMRIRSRFNCRWDGKTEYEHLDELKKILGTEGKELTDEIEAKWKDDAKSLSDYYSTSHLRGGGGKPLDDDESEEIDESLKDSLKKGWNAVKDGAKKVGKKIGDAFKGPFRKGDHIKMSGNNGETVNGTITDWDLGDKTYKVLIGNSYDEGESSDAEFEQEMIEEKLRDIDLYPTSDDIINALGGDAVVKVRLVDEGIYDGNEDGGYVMYRDFEIEMNGHLINAKYFYDRDSGEVGEVEVEFK